MISGSAALPVMVSMLLLAELRGRILVALDDEIAASHARQGLADDAADPAVADQHDVIGEPR